jgi:phosphoribosylcarboxyaminoimidazole (NCAIR) mutase
MVEKYLFLGSGSDKDPGFDDVSVEGIPYKEFMKSKGITVIDKVIESCHGCYDIMNSYSQQMQFLANNGARVVAILQGGLLFGLPSIQATQTTFPIISHPLDLVAYSAFMVPSGHAVIASVGVDNEKKEEKAKALTLAERILNLENPSVNILANNENIEKIMEKNNLFGIASNMFSNLSSDALSLVYGTEEEMKNVPNTSFVVRADSDEKLKDWNYLKTAEERHHLAGWNNVHAMQVRGLDNLVIFATKILSLQRPELIESIKEIGRKKWQTYKHRDLLVETEAAIKNGR